jgi:two-component system LytT family response regulator
VKDGAHIHVIPLDRLDYAQAQDDYVALRTEGKTLLKSQTLAALEASLDPSVFVRVHRSFLVRLERIRALEPYGKNDHVAILVDGTRVPVSREGYARLRELLE